MATKSRAFAGKETYAEELSEAKQVKSGKISPEKFAQKEVKEERGMKKFASGGSVSKQPKSNTGPNVGPNRGMPNPMPTSKAMGTLNRAFASGGKVKTLDGSGKGDYVGAYKKSADGIASKGKTDARQIAMKRGGKC